MGHIYLFIFLIDVHGLKAAVNIYKHMGPFSVAQTGVGEGGYLKITVLNQPTSTQQRDNGARWKGAPI